MSTRPTLLAHLSWKFSHQPETVATEALAHILSGSAAARNALGSFLQSHGADVDAVVRVRTEVTGEEGDRPDLACFDADGTERILIEVKFWAGLTSNQPVAYLERLRRNNGSTLLVVAPARRIEPLWWELRRRVREGMEVELGDDRAGSEVRRAAVGNRRVLILTSWRALLEALESRANDAGDMQVVNDIRQLSGLAVRQDSEVFPLRPEQLGPEFPRLIVRLPRLLDDVYGRLIDMGLVPKKWPNVRVVDGVYRYMILGGCVVWFGARYRLWARFEQTPLWLGFGEQAGKDGMPRKLEQCLGEEAPEPLSSDDVVPIRVRTGCGYYEVLDDVVAQLERFAGLFQEIYATNAADAAGE